jgi:dTDP-4-amino-4,6-dideoxygalactose transaminase
MAYTNVITDQAEAGLLELIRSWDGYEMHTREICAALEGVQRALLAEKFERRKRAANTRDMSIDEMSLQQIEQELDGQGYQLELLPPDKQERRARLLARLEREDEARVQHYRQQEDEAARVEHYRRGNYPPVDENPFDRCADEPLLPRRERQGEDYPF